MDSRDYIFPFLIDSLSGMPADFEIPTGVAAPLCGLFLPRTESVWPERRAYPPRVALLAGGGLWVFPHPESRGVPVSRPVGTLASVEFGRVMLLGWIRLRWPDLEQTLSYNRRSAPIVETFLARLKESWLAPEVFSELPFREEFGAPLTRKFANALSTEIAAGEHTLIRFFQPAIRTVRRVIFKYESWSAGDAMLLTSRRILWITERRKEAQEPYGTISRSAPLRMLVHIRCAFAGGRHRLEVLLRSGETWIVPAAEDYAAEAGEFADRAMGVLRAGAGACPRMEIT